MEIIRDQRRTQDVCTMYILKNDITGKFETICSVREDLRILKFGIPCCGIKHCCVLMTWECDHPYKNETNKLYKIESG